VATLFHEREDFLAVPVGNLRISAKQAGDAVAGRAYCAHLKIGGVNSHDILRDEDVRTQCAMRCSMEKPGAHVRP
jgi:hypothetical protein